MRAVLELLHPRRDGELVHGWIPGLQPIQRPVVFASRLRVHGSWLNDRVGRPLVSAVMRVVLELLYPRREDALVQAFPDGLSDVVLICVPFSLSYHPMMKPRVEPCDADLRALFICTVDTSQTQRI